MEILASILAFPIVLIGAILLAVVLMMTSVEHERHWPFVIGLAALAMVQISGLAQPFNFVIEYPFAFLMLVLAYICAGTAWAIFKWALRVNDHINLFAAWKAKHPNIGGGYANHREWYNAGRSLKDQVPIRISEHKNSFTVWMMYWPISMLNFVVYDLIMKVYDAIYNGLANFLQGISDRAFKKL